MREVVHAQPVGQALAVHGVHELHRGPKEARPVAELGALEGGLARVLARRLDEGCLVLFDEPADGQDLLDAPFVRLRDSEAELTSKLVDHRLVVLLCDGWWDHDQRPVFEHV